MRVHVCLVSEQPMPNYLGIRKFRPDKIVWLYTSRFEGVLNNLEASIKRIYSVSFDRFLIDPYDLDKIRNSVLGLFQRYGNDELSLNATCGTKIMFMGALEVFREKEAKVYYVDTDRERIIFPLKNKSTSLDVHVGVDEYFQLHGQRLMDHTKDNHERIIARKDLSFFLANYNQELCKFLLDLRNIKDKKEDYVFKSFKEKAISLDVKITGENRPVKIEYNYYGKRRRVKIPYNEANYILGGGWLEEWVYLRCIEKGYDDVMMNVKIPFFRVKKRDQNVKNEIDVVVCHHSKLYLVECKVGSYSRDDLFRLSVIKEISGGLFGKQYFVTVERPDELFRIRCQDLKIDIVTGAEIVKFEPVRVGG